MEWSYGDVKKNVFLGYNETIRRLFPGRKGDRNIVSEAREVLSKGKIIEFKKNLKPGQDNPHKLTELGVEILYLIYRINRFNRERKEFYDLAENYYKDFWKKIGEKHEPGKSIEYDRWVLRRWKVKEEEIKSFEDNLRVIEKFRWLYEVNVISILIQCYVRIRDDYKVNEEADRILKLFIMKEIDKQLSIIPLFGRAASYTFYNYQLYDIIGSSIQKSIDDTFIESPNIFLNSSIGNKIREGILTLLLLLRPPENYDHSTIDFGSLDLNYKIDEKTMEEHIRKRRDKLINIENIKEVKRIYENYRNDINKFK